ncbi:MAG: GNAT family N-acetyltransferase [Deltaproteobacteria bacterium]|nr:GNAT family N-acetyltransferase [Deltaproteobacteria bacterium]MBW2594902.1 GNAT family N-acetyltransferase [Deltaproteobacteria bacterium]
MCDYSFIEKPAPDEITQITNLYRRENWWKQEGDNPEMVRLIIAGSHCFLLVRYEDSIVGMGRAVSDGVSDAYIQDVTVMDSFRGKGIGTRIVKILIDRLEKDGINWIGLIAERGSHPFYENLGFSVMENSTPMLRLKI